MTDLYLILHKVRGEPAFDIAEKIMIGEEDGWIIPTSGHRAFPINMTPLATPITPVNEADWKALPDHYQTTKEPPFKLNVRQLLAGFRPTLNFKRRV
jgi:hypothetical protein